MTAAIDLNASEIPIPPPPGASRNPLNQADALWAQSLLRELGFYSTNGDGIWGLGSRDALRDFKAMNGLASDDSWDASTEQRLSGPGLVRADQTFVGGWHRTKVIAGIAVPPRP
jgi:hypothetical protein